LNATETLATVAGAQEPAFRKNAAFDMAFIAL
jgi:hypothetical protein